MRPKLTPLLLLMALNLFAVAPLKANAEQAAIEYINAEIINSKISAPPILKIPSEVSSNGTNDLSLDLVFENFKNLSKDYSNLNLSLYDISVSPKKWLGNYSIPLINISDDLTVNLEISNLNNSNQILEFAIKDNFANDVVNYSSTIVIEDFILAPNNHLDVFPELSADLSVADLFSNTLLAPARQAKLKTLAFNSNNFELNIPHYDIKSIEKSLRNKQKRKRTNKSSSKTNTETVDENSEPNLSEVITITGLKGDQGPRGERGPRGSVGPNGAQGAAGPAGPAGSAGISVFSSDGTSISNTGGDTDLDDFVFGSDQLADKPGVDDDKRFFFDRSKVAFRAGEATASQWDDVNVGDRSIALGVDVTASGYKSIAFGSNSIASGDYSIVFAHNNSSATGTNAISMGFEAEALSDNSIAIGHNVKAETGNGAAVFGRGPSPASKLVNTTANSMAIGFNSTVATVFIGPSSGASTTGNVGIGNSNPLQKLHISGAMRMTAQTSPPAAGDLGSLYIDDSNAFCAHVDGSWQKILGAGSCD